MQTDFLIVGGGSAGAALAARLSERRDWRVILVEAGADTPPDAMPADIDDPFPTSTLNPGYFWPGLEATMGAGAVSRPYPQARVMGGGSSIMGMFALRGLPSDYARWREAGASRFSWEEVTACHARAENDLDRADREGTRHGASPISRLPRAQWPGFVRRLERAAASLGYEYVDDINATAADAFFAMPATSDGRVRSSSARCYLTPAVRARENLTILASTTVTALRFAGRRVVGVDTLREGVPLTLDAREVIVSAGAIHTPALLMRSGIGDADALVRLGIRPLVERRGVGRNLQNHAYQFFAVTLPRTERLAARQRRFAVAGLRASSGLQGCPTGDLMLFALGRVSPRAFGVDVAMLGSALYAPFSKGAVTLASADPQVPPRVDFGMLHDPRAAPRALQAARLAERLLCSPAVAAGYGDAYLLPAGLAVSQFYRRGLSGVLYAAGAKAVLSGPRSLRRRAFMHALPDATPLADAAGDVAISDAQLLASLAPMGHPVGTCTIGDERDPFAVVDDDYRVYGVDGLRVVDASVMPVIPSANTHLPTLMVAEHAAARMLGKAAEQTATQAFAQAPGEQSWARTRRYAGRRADGRTTCHLQHAGL
ncbi:FAD-dependent oxidoreductase [Paraburkholderia sp. A3BS-1L]|uniref:GMC family oxidoreductase n=1 Tax=Paraburkholderia sp. A3BS-1L TaxID=3028375 RepID=UPI003DAA13CD